MRTYAVVRSTRDRDYWLWLAESQRVKTQIERERELLGSRALSAQKGEAARSGAADKLAELFALRLTKSIA